MKKTHEEGANVKRKERGLEGCQKEGRQPSEYGKSDGIDCQVPDDNQKIDIKSEIKFQILCDQNFRNINDQKIENGEF